MINTKTTTPTVFRLDFTANADKDPTSRLSTIISSGACKALEELSLSFLDLTNQANADFIRWLMRTKAAHIQAPLWNVHLHRQTSEALTSPGVDPDLQHLKLDIAIDPFSLPTLSAAIRRGQWGDLWSLDVNDLDDLDYSSATIQGLFEALHQGAPKMTSLDLLFLPDESLQALVEMLCAGGCPYLERLHLLGTIRMQWSASSVSWREPLALYHCVTS